MATPHKCPVCKGEGKVSDRTYIGEAVSIKDCPACKGTGVVWENTEENVYIWA